MKKIYLASPYSDPNPAIQEQRFLAVCKKAGEIMNLGFLVYSPIAHCHPIAKLCNLPKDFKYWQKVNHEFIRWADEMWVLMLPGWKFSDGIKNEIAFADSLGKTVRYLTVSTLPWRPNL
jgi:nucleoside 2-deoxyribosyltransferase